MCEGYRSVVGRVSVCVWVYRCVVSGGVWDGVWCVGASGGVWLEGWSCVMGGVGGVRCVVRGWRCVGRSGGVWLEGWSCVVGGVGEVEE